MRPAELLKRIGADGVRVTLTDKQTLHITGRNIDHWLPPLKKHKTALVQYLIEQAINDWLDYIGEHHEPSRAECLDRCQTDPVARAYFLKRAQEVL